MAMEQAVMACAAGAEGQNLGAVMVEEAERPPASRGGECVRSRQAAAQAGPADGVDVIGATMPAPAPPAAPARAAALVPGASAPPPARERFVPARNGRPGRRAAPGR